MQNGGSSTLHLVLRLRPFDSESELNSPTPPLLFTASTQLTPPQPKIMPIGQLVSRPKIRQVDRIVEDSSKSAIHNIAVHVQRYANEVKSTAAHVENKLETQEFLNQLMVYILELAETILANEPGYEAYAEIVDLIKDTIANFNQEIKDIIVEDVRVKLAAEVVEYIAGQVAAKTADFTLDYFPPPAPVFKPKPKYMRKLSF